MKKLAVSLAAVVLAGVACSGDQALADMELRAQSGIVNVLRDGETINVDGAVELQPGDVILTKNGALAKFALEGGADARQGQILGNSRVVVRSGSAVEAEEGRLLLQVSEPTRALVEGVTARVSNGAFRIDRGFGSVRAGVYRGSIELDAPGQADLAVSALYQATMVAGDLPSQTRPYRLAAADPWDRVLLAEVVDLEEELKLLARGLGTQRSQRPGLDYFRALADGGNVGFMASYLKRKPADLLIGFTIAQVVDGSLERAFREAFDLYDQGARWGVAAKILDAEPRPVVAQLERLILGTNVIAADGSGGTAEFTVAAADASESGAGASIDGAAPPPSSTAPEDPGGDDPSEPTDPQEPNEPNQPPDQPEEPDECSDTAECAVEDVEDQLPGPQPSPSPTQEQDEQGRGLLDGGL